MSLLMLLVHDVAIVLGTVAFVNITRRHERVVRARCESCGWQTEATCPNAGEAHTVAVALTVWDHGCERRWVLCSIDPL